MPNTNPAKMKNHPQPPALSGFQPQNHPLDSTKTIFMLDPEGNIISWNMGAQRIHHYEASEIVGQHFSRFYTEEEQQQGQPARALQLAAYEGKYVAEGLRVRPDRSLFWANVVIEAIRDEGG